MVVLVAGMVLLYRHELSGRQVRFHLHLSYGRCQDYQAECGISLLSRYHRLVDIRHHGLVDIRRRLNHLRILEVLLTAMVLPALLTELAVLLWVQRQTDPLLLVWTCKSSKQFQLV
jgi:hypothetical protein